MEGFQDFIKAYFEKGSPENEYFNGYTTFMMCNPKNRENIRKIRLSFLINNYLNYKNTDTAPQYINYFNENFEDDYMHKFHEPQIDTCDHREEDDDVADHYKHVANKYSIASNMLLSSHGEDDNCRESLFAESLCDCESYISDVSEYSQYSEYFDDYINEFSEEEEEDDYDY